MIFYKKVIFVISVTFLQKVVSQVSGSVCDRIAAGTSFDLVEAGAAGCDFIIMDSLFYSLLNGTNSSLELIMEHEENIFHEGPLVFDDDLEHALYFVSNRLGNTSLGPTWLSTAPAQLQQYINMYRLDLDTKQLEMINSDPKMLMANGADKTPDRKNILSLTQGFNTTGGGVYQLDRETLKITPIVETSFGVPFNSLNDIASTTDGILFFSDPVYGFEQGFRVGEPKLGSNVYRYNIATKELTIVSTDLQRPNGIALLDSRAKGKGCTLFMTDTGYEYLGAQLERGFVGSSDSSLFVMHDISGCFEPSTAGFSWTRATPLKVNVGQGIQDGIQIHQSSELLLHCSGSGAWVWSIPLKKPLGIINLPCTQLAFTSRQNKSTQVIYLLAENKLYSTKLNFGGIPDMGDLAITSNAPLMGMYTTMIVMGIQILAL